MGGHWENFGEISVREWWCHYNWKLTYYNYMIMFLLLIWQPRSSFSIQLIKLLLTGCLNVFTWHCSDNQGFLAQPRFLYKSWETKEQAQVNFPDIYPRCANRLQAGQQASARYRICWERKGQRTKFFLQFGWSLTGRAIYYKDMGSWFSGQFDLWSLLGSIHKAVFKKNKDTDDPPKEMS